MSFKYETWIDDYVALRNGNVRHRCQGASAEMAGAFPELRRVRGYAHHPDGWSTAHWWCETEDGTVLDPTAAQFSQSVIRYEEYDEAVHGPLPVGKCGDCGAFLYAPQSGFCDDVCENAFRAELERSL